MGRTASTRDYLADAGRGVKLEEQTAENSTVLKYKSSDGSNRYVATNNSPEGGGGSAEAPLVVKVTISDRGERTPNKSSQEVLDAIQAGKGVIYSISNGGNSNYCTSLMYCNGFYGEQQIPIIQVAYLDLTDGADNYWSYFSHVGNEIRELIS